MPGFLNSIILPLIAAVAIPVIIHFLNKQKTKEIRFSSLRFLKLIENKSIKRLRLYQILLIIIRMLFLLFLIIAFARPTLKHSLWGGGSSTRTTAVFILDNSYSMQTYGNAGSYFSQVKTALKTILTTFKDEDNRYLLLPRQNDSIRPMINKDIDLKKIHTAYSAVDFSEALNQAAVIFNSQINYNRELYFFSDFRIGKNHIKSKFPDVKIRTYLIKPKKNSPLQDCAIDSVYLKNSIYETGKPVEVRVLLHNYGEEDVDDLRLDLFSSDNRTAMKYVNLKKDESREVVLNYIPKESGMQFLQAELPEDDLPANNAYYFNFLIPDKISLLLVDDGRDIFLKTALKTLAERTVIRLEISDYTFFQGKDFNQYDVIFINNPESISQETIRRLDDFLKNSGKAIFLIPGDNLSPIEINKLFNKNLFSAEKKISDKAAYFAFSRKSIYHNLFNPIFSKYNKTVDLPKIKRYLQINPDSKSKILSLENGDSFLSRYSTAGFYLFSSSFAADWNDFALKGLFVPMLYRVIYSAVQQSAQKNTYVIGEPIIRELTARGAFGKYILNSSHDDRFELMPRQSGGKDILKIDYLNKPGIYKLYKNGIFSDAFSLNLSADELKKPYITAEDFFPNSIWLNTNDDLKKQILEARTGQELWLFFLILALFMLFMEMYVIKKIEGKGL